MPIILNPSIKIRNQIYNVYGNWSRSIKTDDGFKLILYNVDGELHTQLFNLNVDPWEIKDLSNEKSTQEKIALMRSTLKAEMKLTHDNLDIDLPNWGRIIKAKK
jgi:hypothetical protein